MIDFGILGMNARNLQYIKKFNPKKAIRLADDKYRSKQFLSDRGIPVPKTYDLIRNRTELYEYNFSSLPTNELIVKPTKGSRGRGIYRVKVLDEQRSDDQLWEGGVLDKYLMPQSSFPNQLYKVSGEVIQDSTLRRYLVDILDGKSSLNRGHDTILLEELLMPGNGFEQYCEHGLADIRVIVFNLIPVAAMLRMPTKESDGKANLDRGGIGFGVNVSTGRIYSLSQNGKIYQKEFPDEYRSHKNSKLAYRDDILLYSSKVQYFANLGYLALDWVITDEGPKLLEINARAGLKFQLAAVLPLKKRLEKVKDIQVTDPEKGVEIAKTLFSMDKGHLVSKRQIIYLSQYGKLTTFDKNDNKEVTDVIVDVDIKRQKTRVSKELVSLIKKAKNGYSLELAHSHITFNDFEVKKSSKLEGAKIILGRNLAQDYYIKPIKKIFTAQQHINPEHMYAHEVDKLHILDEKLFKLSKSLNLSQILKPTNYLDELDNFITRNGHYNPTFLYNWPSDQKMHALNYELMKLKEHYFYSGESLQSPFAELLLGKLDELLAKHDLVIAYKKKKYQNILKLNERLFQPIDPALVTESKYILFEHSNEGYDLGRLLKPFETRNYIISYLRERGYTGIQVVFDANTTARITVLRRSTHVVIRVGQGVRFREKDLKATLAHEIDVHIRRWKNGQASGWHILRSGTAGFLSDEEGLAVVESLKHLPEGYERMGRYLRFYLLSLVGSKDFAGLASVARGLSEHTLRGVFQDVLRIKKGIQNTGLINEGAVYYKDKVYLDGYHKISNFVRDGGDTEKMMVGKVKVEDLKYL